jgi:hypothetical protein
MPTAFYDEVFALPVACKRSRHRIAASRISEDLEFSEYGRSPRIPAGWYLAPVLLAWPVLLAVLLL